MSPPLRVAVIGAGLIGRRRALQAASHPDSQCVIVVDPDLSRATDVAAVAGARAEQDWRSIIAGVDVDVVVAATPNAFLCEIAVAALEAGKHVLVEKPMGRNLAEAERMSAAANRAGRVLKVGFNHRYHPAIAEAKRRLDAGDIGTPINARFRYGHGGRPGYEKEWRGNRELAGGGELTDQGVHVADLIHWFLGLPQTSFAWLQTAAWPLGDLEDNGFGMFRYPSGVVVSLHTSWTQWINLFSLEIFGLHGAVVVNGLGKSYGVETLTVYRRRPEGGRPESETLEYKEEDHSWRDEWRDFVGGVRDSRLMLGTAADGIAAMRMLTALYRSAATGGPVAV